MTTQRSSDLSGKLHYRLFLAALTLLSLGGAGVIWQDWSGELEHAKRLMAEDLRARAVSLDQSLHVVQAATEALGNEIEQSEGALDAGAGARLLRMAFNSRGTSDIARLIHLHDGKTLCAQEGVGACGDWLAGALLRRAGLAGGDWTEPLQDSDGGWLVAHVLPVSGAPGAWVAAEVRLASLQKYTFPVHSVESRVSLLDIDGHVITDGDSALPSDKSFPDFTEIDRAQSVIRIGPRFVAAERIGAPAWLLVAEIPADSLMKEATDAVLPLLLIVAAILLVCWIGAFVVEIRVLRPARAAGERLAQTLSNLEVTFASVSDGIALLDSDRHLIAANDRFRALLGVKGEAAGLGLLPELNAPGADGRREQDGTVAFQFHNRDGRWVEARLSLWQSGRKSGTVAVLTDITERREATERLTAAKHEAEEALETLQGAQTRLVEAEKLAALGELVAGVAHEINTPIGVAMSAATSLVDQTRHFVRDIEQGALRRSTVDSFKASLTETAAMVERNILRASDLIRQFKQVAIDRASYQRRRFDLRQVVEETVGTLHPAMKRTGYRLEIDIPAGIALDGFPGPLGQVVTNLVTNALAHAFDEREQGVIALSGRALEDGMVELACRDDGVGISAAVQKRMFEPFFTTKRGRGGSGLGMHIVYSLVTGLMGGEVTVDSEPGHGTEIRMIFPASAPDSPSETVQQTGDAHAQ